MPEGWARGVCVGPGSVLRAQEALLGWAQSTSADRAGAGCGLSCAHSGPCRAPEKGMFQRLQGQVAMSMGSWKRTCGSQL